MGGGGWGWAPPHRTPHVNPPHRTLHLTTHNTQHLQSDIGDEELSILGVPNAVPLVYDLAEDGAPLRCVAGRCYVPPLEAHYLGEACMVFNRLDVDGSGGLDAKEMASFASALEEVEGGMARASFDALDGDRDG